MKISQLKNLINVQNNCKDDIDVDINKDYSEVPTIKYEQLDQLRCYIDLAIMFEEEYNQLLGIGKEDFLSNYELVNDFIPSSINIVKSYVNIGLDLNEFLQNSLIIKDIVKEAPNHIKWLFKGDKILNKIKKIYKKGLTFLKNSI